MFIMASANTVVHKRLGYTCTMMHKPIDYIRFAFRFVRVMVLIIEL